MHEAEYHLQVPNHLLLKWAEVLIYSCIKYLCMKMHGDVPILLITVQSMTVLFLSGSCHSSPATKHMKQSRGSRDACMQCLSV